MDKDFSAEYKLLGANVSYFRKRKELSQEDLACLCEVDRSTIGRIETAFSGISLDTVFKIARALDIEPYKLFKEHS